MLFDRIMSAELCRDMLFSGSCPRGDACKFSHSLTDSSPPPQKHGRSRYPESKKFTNHANKGNGSDNVNAKDIIFSSAQSSGSQEVATESNAQGARRKPQERNPSKGSSKPESRNAVTTPKETADNSANQASAPSAKSAGKSGPRNNSNANSRKNKKTTESQAKQESKSSAPAKDLTPYPSTDDSIPVVIKANRPVGRPVVTKASRESKQTPPSPSVNISSVSPASTASPTSESMIPAESGTKTADGAKSTVKESPKPAGKAPARSAGKMTTKESTPSSTISPSPVTTAVVGNTTDTGMTKEVTKEMTKEMIKSSEEERAEPSPLLLDHSNSQEGKEKEQTPSNLPQLRPSQSSLQRFPLSNEMTDVRPPSLPTLGSFPTTSHPSDGLYNQMPAVPGSRLVGSHSQSAYSSGPAYPPAPLYRSSQSAGSGEGYPSEHIPTSRPLYSSAYESRGPAPMGSNGYPPLYPMLSPMDAGAHRMQPQLQPLSQNGYRQPGGNPLRQPSPMRQPGGNPVRRPSPMVGPSPYTNYQRGGMAMGVGMGMGGEGDTMGAMQNTMQVVPIQPSIIATPATTNPGSEMEVTIIIREADFKPDDWLGLFKIHQYQSTKSITQRQVNKLHFARTSGGTERFKKLTCRFYAPKHAGLYAFRYFHALEYWPIMSSNDVRVNIRGSDLDEAVKFVQQKISDSNMLSFNINSLISTFNYITDLNGWKHPEELANVIHAIIDPLSKEDAVLDAYTPQVSSNLKALVELMITKSALIERLGNDIYHRLLDMLRHYCHICNKFILSDDALAEHMAKQHALPAHVPFSRLNPQFLYKLQTQCVNEYHQLCPKEEFYTSREGLIRRLTEGFNKHDRFKDSTINIYGSSNNGFGTDGSDIDLCLVDKSIKSDEVLGLADEVCSILEEMNMVDVDKGRLHARIPVIRFEDPVTGIQCDLCFNNILPIRNTFLLKTYSFVDKRVRVLGIIIKKWAKMNNLNNPVLKTLSSYGYMLLLIHFLQSAVNPPLLPVLQQLPPNWNGMPPPPNTQLPEINVDSYDGTTYNTYFYQPRELQLLNRFANQNVMSVGELLVRFFYYYGFVFDYAHSVVTIRQQGTINREEKCGDGLWKMALQLCIEDPFETDYDVAHVITPISSSLIQECFAKSYYILSNMSRDYSEMTEGDILNAIFKASLYHQP